MLEDIGKTIDNIDISSDEKSLLLKFKSVNKRVLEVDDNKYPAWRIIHNDALGPGKGGIRFHPAVSEDEVKSLSLWMSIKNSLAGLPYGGAKGGITVNPKDMDNKGLESLSRSYIQAFHEYLGCDKDIPAPDVYTDEQIMAWMLDEYEVINGRHEPGMITGKPVALGGCAIRNTATSKGGFVVLKEFLKRERIKGPTIAIQGFGNVGKNIAKFLYEDGFNIVSVSDSGGGIKGTKLDIDTISDVKENRGSVTEAGYDKISNEELLESDVDILILGALENQITKTNMKHVRAGYILEMANGPVAMKASKYLHGQGVVIIPDILANAGGVVGSYLEWVQNKTGNIFQVGMMEKRLKETMLSSFDNVYSRWDMGDTDMRAISYDIAVKRILKAERLRGGV